jgi:scyllo-inositol 2-dehydrogenase (NADP+)
MRVIVVGLGTQGYKRQRVAGSQCVATVDPVNDEADAREITDIPLDFYDAALVCTPDAAKFDMLKHLLENGKHVLVEKPLLTDDSGTLDQLKAISEASRAVLYTAYNHRFEPHFVTMKRLIESGELGRIYAVRMFYGNGTARLVRDSAWRDQGTGVLFDLGSHLLDTILFWLGEENLTEPFTVRAAHRFENLSYDHVVLDSDGDIAIQLEMTLLMWRNHFTCDVLAEKGSAHIESLCKWGPTTFRHRRRVLPSGRPTESEETLEQDDPTWEIEYEHFRDLCAARAAGNIANDEWIERELLSLGAQALEKF